MANARAICAAAACAIVILCAPAGGAAFSDAAAAGGDARKIPAASAGPEVMYSVPSSYAELVGWYLSLEQNYTGYVQVYKANELYGTGQIAGGYDDYYVRLTNESLGLQKPEVLFIGGPHGDETAGTVSMYWFCDWLLRTAFDPGYSGQETAWMRRILDTREVYIEACHNPYGFDHMTRYDANGTDLNREGDLDGPGTSAPSVFGSVQGKTLVAFLNDHQIRVGTDFHGGARMMLYPWGSTHQTVTAVSAKSGATMEYAPPDFNYFDIAINRAAAYMGAASAQDPLIEPADVGTIPQVVGYKANGGLAPWAYGSDVAQNPAEAGFVKEGPYPGAGVLWVSPEISSQKTPSPSAFGGDLTNGLGINIRRYMLHQIDIAQPYVVWQPGTPVQDSIVEPGTQVQLRWSVNGSLVCDGTQAQWGRSANPVSVYDEKTPMDTSSAGLKWGGTGWENAINGRLMSPKIFQATVTLPNQPGDYYFVAKAMVDQTYNGTVSPSTYGQNHTYLRLLKERLWDGWTESVNSTDGNQSISGQKWWHSPVLHLTVNNTLPDVPVVTMGSPVGGENWLANRSHLVNWSVSNGTAPYSADIYLSNDSGITWDCTVAKGVAQGAAGPGQYLWMVPGSFLTRSTCRIKVIATDNKSRVGVHSSIQDFTITHSDVAPPVPRITLLSPPQANATWYRTLEYGINWTCGNGTGPYSIDIALSTNGGATFPISVASGVAQAIAGPGSCTWNISNSTPLSSACLLRATITDSGLYSGQDSGPGMFKIAALPAPPPPPPPPPEKNFTVILGQPNGGESYPEKSVQQITWATQNGTAPIGITLEFSPGGANGTFSQIAANLTDNGSYSWAVPSVYSSDCCIRVTASDALGNLTSDVSDGAFEITQIPDIDLNGSIIGTVRDFPNGTPVAGAAVSLCANATGVTLRTAFCAANGTYSFSSVPPGNYDLKAYASGYYDGYNRGVAVTAQNITRADISVEKKPAAPPAPPPKNETDKNQTEPVIFGMKMTTFALVLAVALLALVFIAAGAVAARRRRGRRREELKMMAFPGQWQTSALQRNLMDGNYGNQAPPPGHAPAVASPPPPPPAQPRM